jgi:hypothetical protein
MAKKPAVKAAKQAAKRTAKEPLRDDGEDVYLLEPMRVSEENSGIMQQAHLGAHR